MATGASSLRWLAACCGAALAATASAEPLQSVLAPAGPQAAHLKDLWDVMLLVCTVVFVAVLVAVGIALWRAPRTSSSEHASLPEELGPQRGARRSVVSAVVASTLLLLFLIVASVFTDRALARLSLHDALHIEVTANQWWWEARYDDAQASRMFNTANELHIPVGRPVVLTLRSNDVIHSFWVPALHGKKDLIPGRTSTLRLQADQAGTYRGQCAEFCGYQHTTMALLVVAEPAAQYEAWAEHQRTTAALSQEPQAARGRHIFMTTTCVMCHAIQGTDASARRGPDLTHVAQRQTLAAGALPNTPENLERWIRNPQHIKPGANMPPSDLPGDDVRALVAYLGSLR
jgi:cytochrome c oxidase subunit 2